MRKNFGPTSKQRLNYTKIHDELVHAVVIAVAATKLAKVWPNPTGAAYRENQLIRYGLIGSADITGILVNGKRLDIEVKTGNAVQSPAQIAFQTMVTNMGGHYILARSVESAVESVKSIFKE